MYNLIEISIIIIVTRRYRSVFLRHVGVIYNLFVSVQNQT